MTTHRLAPTLVGLALVPACVQEQNLSDPQELMSGSESGGSDESTSDPSDSATSTTGDAPGCAGNDGTLTSLEVYIGPDESPTLFGISDAAIHPSGAIDIAFIQGDHIWAEIDATGDVTFGDPPGDLSHVGYVSAAADGRRLVSLDWWNGDDAGDWLQMIAPGGEILWNADVFVGGAYSNLPDEHLMLADGGALVHVYWIDEGGAHSRLTHFDAAGIANASDEYEDPDIDLSVRDMIQAGNGDVWALRQHGNDGRIDRYAAGSFDAPAQSIAVPGRWMWQLRLDSDGRLVVLSTEPSEDPVVDPTISHVEIRNAADGAVIADLASGTTAGFEAPVAIATGPCGEIFVAGVSLATYGGWVARVGEAGVLWSDTLAAEGALFADVAADGTLVVVGQTSAEIPDNVTVAPYVARYEP